MDVLTQMLIALLPSIGIGWLFYKIMRTILEGDRTERAAYARWQAEHDAQARRARESQRSRDS